MNSCMGDCEEHLGEVKLFRVIDPIDNFDWGIYAYCEEAVKEDTRKGFNLEEQSE